MFFPVMKTQTRRGDIGCTIPERRPDMLVAALSVVRYTFIEGRDQAGPFPRADRDEVVGRAPGQ